MKIDAAHFYTYDELTEILQRVASTYPDLVSLFSVAESPKRRSVWCVEVANRTTGLPLEDRPAVLMTGNLHAIELAGSCGAMHLLGHLIEGYAQGDGEVRRLLDEQVFYIVPRLTVDTTDYVLASLHEVRSRDFDVKEANTLVPQDVNQDGRILFMRWKRPDGGYVKSSRDDRLMLPVSPNEESEAPRYDMAVEGVIHEPDGTRFSRRLRRLDFNRNFPAGWKPSFGSLIHGRYPLSEPETRGLAEFVLAHPNITRVVDYHTGNTAVFPPSAAVKGEAMHDADATLIAKLGRRAEELTGFPFISGYTELSTGRTAAPLPGSFNDWIYEHTGAYTLILELGDFHNFLGISTADYVRYATAAEREEQVGLTLLAWHDCNPDAGLFFEWEPFDHPQLGSVEIGGLNWVDWRNPPLHEMEQVCSNCTRFVMEYAALTARVAFTDPVVTKLADRLYKVEIDVRNDGSHPTHVTRRGLETHPEDVIEIGVKAANWEAAHSDATAPAGTDPATAPAGTDPADSPTVNGVEFIVGKARHEIGHLTPGARKHLEWVIRTNQAEALLLTLRSARGVYAERTIQLERGA